MLSHHRGTPLLGAQPTFRALAMDMRIIWICWDLQKSFRECRTWKTWRILLKMDSSTVWNRYGISGMEDCSRETAWGLPAGSQAQAALCPKSAPREGSSTGNVAALACNHSPWPGD